MAENPNSFGAKAELNGKTIYRLDALQSQYDVARLPFSLKVLLENLLRTEGNGAVTKEDIEALATWDHTAAPSKEIAFTPARVVMQDFTGVPAVVDLAAMRDAMADLGGDPQKIEPLVPAELVIDHSVQVDAFGTADAFRINAQREHERNEERYRFLRWGQGAFESFKVVPPDTGIVHQVNLEYLSRVVFTNDATGEAYPDTLVGTDSHTTMVNGLGVLGWGVGGIEAEAAMLGQPMSMLIPQVIGFKLHGALPEGTTATDLVLTVTEMLRKKGVVGKFVEFYGAGVSRLPLADRATIGNMSPEFGSTCAIFPIDAETIRYMAFTGRPKELLELTEAYAREQGMWHDEHAEDPTFTDTLELDLGEVVPSLAGPKRPQDRVPLTDAKERYREALGDLVNPGPASQPGERAIEDESALGTATRSAVAVNGEDFKIDHGHVVIAAITSCTNTSNPSVMLGAGLLARNAAARGLKSQPWVKTSLAPGSLVVTEYLDRAGLTDPLNELGFNLVGYGCTTCIGNSGPLPDAISAAVNEGDLAVCSVLSGNRNFEGRINPDVKMNYLASPPLVVAYALAGTMDIDLLNDPLGQDADGADVYLRDIWPSAAGGCPHRRGGRPVGHVPHELRQGLRRRRQLALARRPRGRQLRLGRRLDLRAQGAVLRRHPARARGSHRHRGCKGPRQARRQRHDRPHLAGRRDQEGRARGQLPGRARRRAEGLQLLRLTPRQPRGDDPRHVREHPPAQPARARHRGWRHASRTARRCRSTTPRWPTRRRACRSSCSAARSTARARRATGRRKARTCSACAP